MFNSFNLKGIEFFPLSTKKEQEECNHDWVTLRREKTWSPVQFDGKIIPLEKFYGICKKCGKERTEFRQDIERFPRYPAHEKEVKND